MKIGIISFAHMHAYSYANCLRQIDGVELTMIADESEERGRKMAQQFGTQFYKDYQALLAQDVDAVVICSENARHAEMVIAAAHAKKHILCEKPISTNVEDAKKMIAACEQNQVKLQIAFPVRFSTPVQRVKRMIDEDKLGRILTVRGTNRGRNPGGWFVDPELSGGGAVMDHTVHVIDIMRWYLKSEVREVYAEIDTRFNDIPSDDCGLLMLEFENGVIASHDPSWSRCKSFPTWGDVTMEIVGTGGTTHVDALAQNFGVYSDKTNQFGYRHWGDNSDLALISDFVACIQEQRTPSISGEDGLRAMEVALAAYQSARTGQPVFLR